MFFDAKAMLAFNVVEQMTLFAEAQGAFIAFVCFNRVRHRSSLFIKPQAYLILIYGTIINGRIITFNRISDILLLDRVFILFWICCCYSALSLHFIRYFSLWTLYQYFWWKSRLIAFLLRIAKLILHRLLWCLSEWKSLIIDVRWWCRMPITVQLLIYTDWMWLFEERNPYELYLIETR